MFTFAQRILENESHRSLRSQRRLEVISATDRGTQIIAYIPVNEVKSEND